MIPEAVGVVVGETVGVGVAVGVGVVLTIFTPADQTRFLPFFMQVNFKSFEMVVVPTFVHFAPAFGAAAKLTLLVSNPIDTARTKSALLRM